MVLEAEHSGQTQPQISQAPRVRIYPIIAAAAIRRGQASAFRLYTVAQYRATLNSGRAIFSRFDLLTLCCELGILNEQQLDRALKDGGGLFWTYSPEHKTYKLISRAKVAAALGFTGNPGRAVALPLQAYRGRLADFKAAVYAAFLGQQRKTTPSREFLCEMFGVTVPTLLDWERRTRVKVRPRIVMAKPVADVVQGSADYQQQAAAALSDETERNRTKRVWVTIVTKRGRVIAGRRLMDNENTPLPDYWDVQQEPGWEVDSRPLLAWQTTNDYQSPLDVAPKGRGRWLKSDIKRLSTPDVNALGGTQNRPSTSHSPKWHDDTTKVDKWQSRRSNRDRPAVVARYFKHHIVGLWRPSHAALWGEEIR